MVCRHQTWYLFNRVTQGQKPLERRKDAGRFRQAIVQPMESSLPLQRQTNRTGKTTFLRATTTQWICRQTGKRAATIPSRPAPAVLETKKGGPSQQWHTQNEPKSWKSQQRWSWLQ